MRKILSMVIISGLILFSGLALAQEEPGLPLLPEEPGLPPLPGAEAREVEIIALEGTASIKKADNPDWIPAFPGDILKMGDTLRTDPMSTADLNVDGSGETAVVKVSENAEIIFNKLTLDSVSNAKETILDLAIGSILIKASKLEAESKFEVNTPTSIVGVRGTTFEVRVSAAE